MPFLKLDLGRYPDAENNTASCYPRIVSENVTRFSIDER